MNNRDSITTEIKNQFEGRMYTIPLNQEYSEISLKQLMMPNPSSLGDLKDMDAINPIGTHILNKDVKDVVLEDVQNQDKWMDIRGDTIAVRMNYSSVKLLKWNNFGINFILKHKIKILDFALISSKHLAVLDKDNILTFYLKTDKPKEITNSEISTSPKKQNSGEEK